jgi:predicted  nucleic acid-binding Zn-ribbon protein
MPESLPVRSSLADRLREKIAELQWGYDQGIGDYRLFELLRDCADALKEPSIEEPRFASAQLIDVWLKLAKQARASREWRMVNHERAVVFETCASHLSAALHFEGSEAERAVMNAVSSGDSRQQPVATQEVDALHALKAPTPESDSAEWLCTKCHVIHPPQEGRTVLQPCPDCGCAMLPTSQNRREIERLKDEIQRLIAERDGARMNFRHTADRLMEAQEAQNAPDKSSTDAPRSASAPQGEQWYSLDENDPEAHWPDGVGGQVWVAYPNPHSPDGWNLRIQWTPIRKELGPEPALWRPIQPVNPPPKSRSGEGSPA